MISPAETTLPPVRGLDDRFRRTLEVPGVLADAGRTEGTVVVDVPGGRLSVQVGPGTTVLTGPAVLVSAGSLCREWLEG